MTAVATAALLVAPALDAAPVAAASARLNPGHNAIANARSRVLRSRRRTAQGSFEMFENGVGNALEPRPSAPAIAAELLSTHGVINVPSGKGGKSRLAVTPPGLVEDVEALGGLAREAPEWLFPSRKRKGHLRSEELRRKYERAASRAKLPRPLWRPHIGRHTFGTLSVEAGADVAAVQVQLGHADPKTTGRYLHHRIGEMADRIRQATPARGFERGERQLSLDGMFVPDLPAALPPTPEPAERRRVWRTRLWRRIGADGAQLDQDVELLPHGLGVRPLARKIGVAHQLVSGAMHCRHGFGEYFMAKAVAAFAGEYTREQLFYQVEEE